MNKRLTRIAPLQLGIVLAVFYGLLGLLFAPFIFLGVFMSAAAPNAPHQFAAMSTGVGVVMVVLIPITYGIMGLIFGMLTAVIYNLVAKMTGGIEITTIEVPAMIATYVQ